MTNGQHIAAGGELRFKICTVPDRAGVGRRPVMSSYGQFCPVAKAMELLDER